MYGHRHISAALLVQCKEGGVVHLVDVITGKEEHNVNRLLFNQIQVVAYRIGGTTLPSATIRCW